MTNSASVFHRPSWVPRAHATLIQDVFHNLIPRFRGLRGFVNLHHFILNCANWKLRDSRLASLLQNKRGQGKEVAATYGVSVAGVFHWLAASSADAWGLLISFVRLGSEAALVFATLIGSSNSLDVQHPFPVTRRIPHSLRAAFHEYGLEWGRGSFTFAPVSRGGIRGPWR